MLVEWQNLELFIPIRIDKNQVFFTTDCVKSKKDVQLQIWRSTFQLLLKSSLFFNPYPFLDSGMFFKVLIIEQNKRRIAFFRAKSTLYVCLMDQFKSHQERWNRTRLRKNPPIHMWKKSSNPQVVYLNEDWKNGNFFNFISITKPDFYSSKILPT